MEAGRSILVDNEWRAAASGATMPVRSAADIADYGDPVPTG
jgi:hypothetical protein